ncbi:phosphatidylinositol 4-kinase alpha 2 [Telopea speciosissima]|uniref:phosphatidylinositol 4-kinase alpha 2 n=1 Tax=Telopea speciosissima TaxID=54955 RepID=UPI001CC4092B|nr:phosphatidylinositol 4-kinase alpha 2 [Telopea speciosissima]
MITFNVVDRDGDHNIVKPQACIFKVGDDCRQDVLALQVISLLEDIFEAVGLNLYLFPYGVLPTGPGRGIIEVVPNTRSRSQMGETTDGGLYEIFQQDYGPVGSDSFEAARDNFIISSAGYAVASLLLQPKDRHNGNLLFDNVGRLVHIDFGFILETSPGNNMRFESAHFKLSHEMTQLLDPSGVMKSETWLHFVSLCVKGYLAARRYMNGILNTVLMMVDSGLPCFSRGDPIGNLRKRFHPEMSEREAANFMIKTCADAYNKWTTAGYDLIQYLQQGIEK